MSKVGLAACSRLTLGCVALLDTSLLPGGIGRGLTKPVPLTSCCASSPVLPDSKMPRNVGVAADSAAVLRAVCSFCGGAGASSTAGAAPKLSPRGPRGPRESSRASRVVDCAPNLRVGRCDRFTGLFTAAADAGRSFSLESDVSGRAAPCQPERPRLGWPRAVGSEWLLTSWLVGCLVSGLFGQVGA